MSEAEILADFPDLRADDLRACLYPETSHVRDHGLKSAPDSQVWSYANGCTIVTKDAAFHHRSFLHRYPPKVIWIRLGNCSTREEIELFLQSFLVLA